MLLRPYVEGLFLRDDPLAIMVPPAFRSLRAVAREHGQSQLVPAFSIPMLLPSVHSPPNIRPNEAPENPQ